MRTGQFAGQEEQLVSQFCERQVLPRFLQTIPLKGRDQVGGESNDLQIQRIGCKRGGGNLAQSEVFTEFANPRLHARATVVEVPDPGGRQFHVGHPSAVDVAAQREPA